MSQNPADMRVDYDRDQLVEEEADADPFRQFQIWFDAALQGGLVEPNAMTLATVNAEGHPSARTILLKGYDERGFVFYTNTLSRKGHELAQNQSAALMFWWDKMHRQVRIEGVAEPVDPSEADAYYTSRPYGSRIGAWASEQSREIPSRAVLAERTREFEQLYPEEVPRPPHWSGYRVVPDMLEFWQGRRSRLHDRLCYRRIEGDWRMIRLAP
ncbi:MAG: pyridoxamine 5'-phosphate oxidase [Pseudomonadota bacterium]